MSININKTFNNNFISEKGITFKEYIDRNILSDLDIVQWFRIKVLNDIKYVIVPINDINLLFNFDMIYKLYKLYESNDEYTISYKTDSRSNNIVNDITNDKNITVINVDSDDDNSDSDFRRQLNKEKRRNNILTDQLQKEIDNVESLKKTIDQYRLDITDLQSKLYTEKTNANSIRSHLNSLNTSGTSVNDSILLKCQQQLNDSNIKIKALEHQISESEASLRFKNGQFDEIYLELQECQRKLKVSNNKIEDLEKELSNCNTILESDSNKINELNTEITQLKSIHTTNPSVISETNIKDRTNEIFLLKKDNENLELRNAFLRRQNPTVAQSTNNQLQSVTQQSNQASSSSISKLENIPNLIITSLTEIQKKIPDDVKSKYEELKNTIDDELSKKNEIIKNNASTIDDLKARLATATQNCATLETLRAEYELRIQKLSEATHFPGVFPHTSPAFPDDFVTHVSNLLGTLKSYSGESWTRIPKETKNTFVNRFRKNLNIKNTNNINMLFEQSPVPSRRAVLMGSLSREMFRYFDNDCFSPFGTRIPLTNRPKIREEAGDKWRALMNEFCTKLLDTDVKFKSFYEEMIERLKKLFCSENKKEEEWKTYFESENLIELMRRLFALHSLVRAFPWIPQLMCIENDTQWNSNYCTSFSNADEDGIFDPPPDKTEIICMVFPGFLLDNDYIKCDVYCMELNDDGALKKAE